MLLFQATVPEPYGPCLRLNCTRTGLVPDYTLVFELTSEKEDRCVLFPKATEPHWVIASTAPILSNFGLDARRPDFCMAPMTTFWGSYGEPLAEWFAEAEDLCSIIRSLNSKDSPECFEKIAALNHLLISTGHHLRLDGSGEPVRESYASSLLGAFAAMFAQDLLANPKRVVTCPVCGALAASSSYRRTYCSNGCAWRARKRKQRENDRKKVRKANK